MSDTPKLHVYVVAALFSPAEVPDGKMITNTWFSPDPHGATAAVTTRFVQQTGETQPLQTVMVHELTEEWLVAALNAIRTGGKPGEVTPLRVVPEAPDVMAAARKEVYENAGTQFQDAPSLADSLAEQHYERIKRLLDVKVQIGRSYPPNGDGDAA